MAIGGDFDRRVALISVDNAVELMVKTYLGLPERARGSKGPTRKELEQASESFPELLSLLETNASSKITGLSLGDIEWYHRLRNQLYHSGNGITVDRSKVEGYVQLSLTLFENLFGYKIEADTSSALKTKTGQFLYEWNIFQNELRKVLPPKKDELAWHWKTNFLEKIKPEASSMYASLSMFRNEIIHGLSEIDSKDVDRHLLILTELKKIIKK
jgi:uncharacterized protein YutE (UPF0331/DUF86 family)